MGNTFGSMTPLMEVFLKRLAPAAISPEAQGAHLVLEMIGTEDKKYLRNGQQVTGWLSGIVKDRLYQAIKLDAFDDGRGEKIHSLKDMATGACGKAYAAHVETYDPVF